MYNKILLPSDGSKNSDHAIKHALQIASDEGAEITVLHVVDSKHLSSLSDEALDKDDLIFDEHSDEVLDHVLGVIDELRDELGIASDIKVSTLTVEGNPADVIVRVCEKKSMDMVIMANSGKHKLDRFLLGSVTEKTIREAPVPVLVIPANYSPN
ncbi:universal stress protein [Methanosphaera sp. ISO3-F5]|uniref:universal stress protein n=1 Tax=Methanosphaera sp. ISO3-F5 TaxID=1452353 RepID=UPI002B263438|nr:universal stress protein [Methanosphaera sp. ISO3-F5]WQH63922.1 universal stress protein [Methanosphaera sp. ISO3-F5]